MAGVTKIIYRHFTVFHPDLTMTSFTATQQASGYPVDNLRDYMPRVPWRSTSAATTNTVTAQWSANVTANVCAIMRSNLSGSGAISLAHSPDGTTWTSITTSIPANGDVYYIEFTSAADKYWRFSVADATNPDGYHEVGSWWLGFYESLSRSYSVADGRRVEYSEGNRRIIQPGTGLAMGTRAVRGTQIVELQYRSLSEADWEIWNKAWQYCGDLIPVGLIFHSTADFSGDRQLYDGFYQFERAPVAVERHARQYDVTVRVRELAYKDRP